MTVNQITYTADDLANIRLSRGIDGKGFYGIVTSEFSCDIYTDYPFFEGTEITFDGYLLPTFIITEQSFENNVNHVVAYDRCKNLDIPFDYSGYEQFDSTGAARWYPTTQIVSALAHQCGFSSGGYSGRISQLCYLDFAEKSCRQILLELAKADGAIWSCSDENALTCVSFSPASSGVEISENDRSDIKISGEKTILGIYAEDEVYGTEYSTGAAWRHTERFSGRYLSADIASQLAGQILSGGGSYTYYGWECSSVLTDMLFNIGDCISYDGKLLPILNEDFSFTDLGIIGSFSAPAPDNSFSEYQDLYSRKIAGKLSLDKSYGDCGLFVSEKSCGFRLEL